MKASLLPALLLVLSACTSSREARISYDQDSDKTTYSSSKALVGNIGMTGGLASGQRVMMQAFATCDGPGCNPSEIEIAFLNDTSSDLNLDYRRVEIVAGPRHLEWEDALRLSEPTHFSVPRGEFIRVPLNRADFKELAEAANVEIIFGLTGTTPFRVPADRRVPLRDLLHLIENSTR